MAEEKLLTGPGHRAILHLEDGSTVTLWVPGRDVADMLDRLRFWTGRGVLAVRLTVEAVD